MNSNYKYKITNEILEEHLQQLKSHAANRIRKSKPPSPTTITLTPTSTPNSISPISTLPSASQHFTIEPMRSRCDSSAASIYIIGNENCHRSVGNDNRNDNVVVSNPPTIERQQQQRLSWMNMQRFVNNARNDENTANPIVTSSPQTMRSYVSNITTNMDQMMMATVQGDQDIGKGFCTNISGRTTVTSGCVSSSGITTINGSNKTLNTDPTADYLNQTYEVTNDELVHVKDGASTILEAVLKSHLNTNGSTIMVNGSTVKLIPNADDETNPQTKCSVFRGLILCICLNVTYGNIVRFPRELDKYGLAYLVPYVILLFLVGLPIVLLEISIGQFLGQGAAHTWRASPIFKGACIISRFASWISTIWISLHVVLAMAYIGMFSYRPIPFKECLGTLKISLEGYMLSNNSGQECMQRTFLTPFWENPFFFGLLSIAIVITWLFVMLGTHNGRFVRRILFVGGLMGFSLLCLVTGWEVNNSLNQLQPHFPELWPFSTIYLSDSNVWFSALMQIIFSLNCGFGVLPTLTGKLLYKGDAVRTTLVYACFNLLINALAVTLFMVQFDHSSNGGDLIEELKPLTAIYDRVLYDKTQHNDNHDVWKQMVLPILIYALVNIAGFLSIIMAIYTTTRLVPRHPNYIICLVALVAAIISFALPKFYIARLLDSRIVGTLVITALVFKLIALTWIYGAKNIYTDLEFSIGRPIFKGWMFVWCICPAILTGFLVWWCSDDDQYDILSNAMPRWAPILFALAIIAFIACVQIFRQVEYNFFGMICEASKSAKEWGPADPLARHAWKQWRSVCQDTGHRDFTLRRRGTRDYTHSIKKGQYSSASHHKYATNNGRLNDQQQRQQQHQEQLTGQNNQQHQQMSQWKSGNSSPNYSGSVFGDSAIEEDISVDKFPSVTQHHHHHHQQQQQQHQQQHQQQRHHQQQSVPFSNTLQDNTHNNNSNNNDDDADIKQLRYSHRLQLQQQPQRQQPSSQNQRARNNIKLSQQTQAQAQSQSQHNHIELVTNQPQTNFTSTPYHQHSHHQKHQQPHHQQQHQHHREIVYIRRLSNDNEDDGRRQQAHATRIEITPSNESITYKGVRNPLALSHCENNSQQQNKNYNYIKRTQSSDKIDNRHHQSHYPRQNQRNSIGTIVNRNDSGNSNAIQLHSNHDINVNNEQQQHICWRKFTMNPEEYSTEL